MENITVLGSTGSIGRSTLDVVRRNSDRFRVFALGAGSNVEQMFADVMEFKPDFAVLSDESASSRLKDLLAGSNSVTKILSGYNQLSFIASHESCDSVMAAIVGAAGLIPALAAVRAGKKLYLANKESLVMTGHLFIMALKESGSRILPVDSEHNAIFQSLPTWFLQYEGCRSFTYSSYRVRRTVPSASSGSPCVGHPGGGGSSPDLEYGQQDFC